MHRRVDLSVESLRIGLLGSSITQLFALFLKVISLADEFHFSTSAPSSAASFPCFVY